MNLIDNVTLHKTPVINLICAFFNHGIVLKYNCTAKIYMFSKGALLFHINVSFYCYNFMEKINN